MKQWNPNGEGAESAEEMECETIEPHTENSF